MQTNEQYKTKNRRNWYIALGAAILIIITLGVLYYLQNREMTQVVDEMKVEKDILTEEYQELAMGYDSLESNSDTLNTMLEQEREKVEHLIEEIKTLKATNAAKIREYRKELSTLRGILKSYVAQIDSLNRINEELKRENVEYQQRYSQIENSYNQLESEKSELEGKVEIASRLETEEMRAEGLNSRGRSTRRINRIDKIEVCFTVKKNSTAPVGMKPFYIRIERPDGQILLESRDNQFEYENSEIHYTAMREVEYGGDAMEICIFYDVDMGELMEGDYTTDVFADGANIGRFTFELR